MPYNFVPDSFHTVVTAKALRAKIDRQSAILHQRGHFDPKFLFLGPPLGNLGATYNDRLRLIGKRVVDFLLALIELFSLGLRLRSYERLLVENRRFRSNGGRLTQNFT